MQNDALQQTMTVQQSLSYPHQLRSLWAWLNQPSDYFFVLEMLDMSGCSHARPC